MQALRRSQLRHSGADLRRGRRRDVEQVARDLDAMLVRQCHGLHRGEAAAAGARVARNPPTPLHHLLVSQAGAGEEYVVVGDEGHRADDSGAIPRIHRLRSEVRRHGAHRLRHLLRQAYPLASFGTDEVAQGPAELGEGAVVPVGRSVRIHRQRRALAKLSVAQASAQAPCEDAGRLASLLAQRIARHVVHHTHAGVCGAMRPQVEARQSLTANRRHGRLQPTSVRRGYRDA
mmetsp:Transcript_58369/g.169346  ORF Transcript_58369/g.169346 Transcript_58369/m.169346 type:complete len:232 (-) Transcript_58369:167-862(-)